MYTCKYFDTVYFYIHLLFHRVLIKTGIIIIAMLIHFTFCVYIRHAI